jgi:hypothetical protein
MAKNSQRLSQLVSTFGPGSMVDLPTRSVIVGGLDLWEGSPASRVEVKEPRLREKLERLLKDAGRLDQARTLSLFAPPVDEEIPGNQPRGVRSPVFPRTFVCDEVETTSTGASRRRLADWKELDVTRRKTFELDDGRKSSVTPLRFVCACDRGHLEDIRWRWVVHGPTTCKLPMWMEERGTSADPADTSIVCTCGKSLSLQDAFQPNRLGVCDGKRPWLTDQEAGCGSPLKLLIRTATNTYFPQILRVISLPQEDDALTALVRELRPRIERVKTLSDLDMLRSLASDIDESLRGHGNQAVFEKLQLLRSVTNGDSKRPMRLPEFDVLASGTKLIGRDAPDARLHAETVERTLWDASSDPQLSPIKSLVAVHRLREVSAIYGFTRFEAAPTSSDGELEDLNIDVNTAPISRDADWLPAIEQFGEGIFIHFDEMALQRWLARPEVMTRDRQLSEGHNRYARRFARPPEYPGAIYVLLHSLSHILMSEIALYCGYPASSLKERIYALKNAPGLPVNRCGLLIYTASTGALGTLGGLVGLVPKFAEIFTSALRKAELCSSDPICADHRPAEHEGDRATHGAACHGCLLIAETSCENRNMLLDRSLLVETIAKEQCALWT